MALRKPRPAKERRSPQPAERGADPDRVPARGPRFRASLRNDGSLTIPASVRRLMNIEPGGELDLEITFEGLVVRPVHEGRDPEQWWFWTEAWQKGEREVDQEAALGEGHGRRMSGAEFLAALEAIDREDFPHS